MKISEVKLLLNYDVARFICLGDERFVSFINKVSESNFKFRSEIDRKIESVYKKMAVQLLDFDAYRLANLYLNHEERISIYHKFFVYSSQDYSNGKSGVCLLRIEERLKLDKLETLEIRETFFKRNYFEDLDLISVTKGMLSYFWISFANDSVVDKVEWDYFKSLTRKLEVSEKVAIVDFDLSALVRFSSVDTETLKGVKKLMLEAAQSDGVVKVREVNFVQKLVSLLNTSEPGRELSINSQLLMTLAVMLSDGELASDEKLWFEKLFKSVGKSLNMNEAFIYLDLISKNETLFKANEDFFSSVWGEKDKNFEFVTRLYLTYAKSYLKLDASKLEALENSIKKKSLESIQFLKKFKEEVVTSEELMILYGVLTSDYYSLKKINDNLDYKYIEKIFLELKTTSTKIEYFFIASALMLDTKVVSKEYDVVWKKCQKLNLNFSLLQKTIRNLSLLNQRQYNIDTYHTYLSEEL